MFVCLFYFVFLRLFIHYGRTGGNDEKLHRGNDDWNKVVVEKDVRHLYPF